MAATLAAAALAGAAPVRADEATHAGPPAAKAGLDLSGHKRVGKASFYARRFFGRTMADGTPMDPAEDNAASKTLPLGTRARVTNLETGQSAVVTIQDRGPYVKGRIVDLSPSTASKIGLSPTEGVAPVGHPQHRPHGMVLVGPDDQGVCSGNLGRSGADDLTLDRSAGWRLGDDEAAALARGDHADPFAVLGPHATPSGLAVRAFIPGAETLEARSESGGWSAVLDRREPAGLFEGLSAEGRPDDAYRLVRIERSNLDYMDASRTAIVNHRLAARGGHVSACAWP